MLRGFFFNCSSCRIELFELKDVLDFQIRPDDIFLYLSRERIIPRAVKIFEGSSIHCRGCHAVVGEVSYESGHELYANSTGFVICQMRISNLLACILYVSLYR